MRYNRKYFGTELDKTSYYYEELKLILCYVDKEWLRKQLKDNDSVEFYHDICKSVWDYNIYNLAYMYSEPLLYNIAYYSRSIKFKLFQQKIIKETLRNIFKEN